jgi:hypothetical protein
MPSHVGNNAIESCLWRRCRDDLVTARCRCRVMLAIMLSSYACDDTAEATWHNVDVKSCWRQCCRVVLVMTLLRRLDHSMMSMLSHTGNNAVESCSTMLLKWLGRSAIWMPSHAGDDVAESCWRRCYRGDLAAARCICRVISAIMPPSHAGDDATEVTWPWRDVDAKSCWR